MVDSTNSASNGGMIKILVALIGATGLVVSAIFTGVLKVWPTDSSSPANENSNTNNIIIDLSEFWPGTTSAPNKKPSTAGTTQSQRVDSINLDAVRTNPDSRSGMMIEPSMTKHIEPNTVSTGPYKRNNKASVKRVEFIDDQIRIYFEAKGENDMDEPFKACLREQPSRENAKLVRAPLRISDPGHFEGYLSFESDFLKGGSSYYLEYYCSRYSGAFLFSVSE